MAVFTALRGWESAQVPGWLRPPLAVVISSAVAGAATAPVAAAHFNAVAQYGLLANVLSVPVMASVVIPAAVIAACLAPLGWAGPALTVMGWGLDWILGVAHWVAGWPDARIGVVSPGPWVLPLVAIGALWIMLWQGRGRWAGTVPLVVAFALWSGAERPLALATDSGGLVGVMTADGRALSKPKGSGFVARVWLENDGDLVQQADAAERWPQGGGKVRRADLGQAVILHVAGKRAAAAFPGCAPGDIVVANVALSAPCEVFDPARLRKTGSLALYPGPQGPRLITARDLSGDRIWNPPRRGRDQ
ncbi:MAG: ComEC/Rec2 family competence protein [Marinibacterium sp.]